MQKVTISNQKFAKTANFGEISVLKSLRYVQDLPCVKISYGNSLALACYTYLKLGLVPKKFAKKIEKKIMFKKKYVSLCISKFTLKISFLFNIWLQNSSKKNSLCTLNPEQMSHSDGVNFSSWGRCIRKGLQSTGLCHIVNLVNIVKISHKKLLFCNLISFDTILPALRSS